MYPSFAHYIYKIVEVQAKFVQISYFFSVHNFGITVVTEGIMKLLTIYLMFIGPCIIALVDE